MILKETGWTRHYLLWKVSWINIRMMIADAPALKRRKKKDTVKAVSGKELAARWQARKSNG